MLKVFSLNIEGDRHLDRFPQKVLRYKPDVVCLMEVFEADLDKIKTRLKMKSVFFAPGANIVRKNLWRISPRGIWGQVVLTNLDTKCTNFYYGRGEDIPDRQDDPNDHARVLQIVEVNGEDTDYVIMATHFTRSDSAEVLPEQREDFVRMVEKIDGYPDALICGDFNLHRGNELWSKLSYKYVDNVPTEVDSTLDPNLFRKKGLKVVCDGFFTKGNYRASNVEVVCGLSDHCGIVGNIELKLKAQ